MKLILTILLLAAGCSSAVLAQAVNGKKAQSLPAEAAGSKPGLQVTASIVEQKHHCSTFVGFTARLTFKNVGEEPILLNKRSFIWGLTVSRDLEAVAARRYEQDRNGHFFGNRDFFEVDPSDPSNFVILKPEETFSIEGGIGSFHLAEATPPPKGYLNPGTYFLQLKVITWTYAADPAPLRKKWRDKGILWSEALTSSPIPFTVKIDGQSPDCR